MSELVSELAIVEATPVRTLAELADDANRSHETTIAAMVSAIAYAIQCGETLIAAREIVGKQSWREWMTDNLCFSYVVAGNYMRLAHYKDLLPPEAMEPYRLADGRMIQPSIARAVLYVKGLPPVHDSSNAVIGVAPEVAAEVIALSKNKDVSQREIARMLGISRWVVFTILHPGVRQTQAANQRRARAREKAREQARERATKRAVRQVGAALAELYANAERMQDVLGQARRETNDPQAREALDRAGEHYRKMRDEIVRALGVSA